MRFYFLLLILLLSFSGFAPPADPALLPGKWEYVDAIVYYDGIAAHELAELSGDCVEFYPDKTFRHFLECGNDSSEILTGRYNLNAGGTKLVCRAQNGKRSYEIKELSAGKLVLVDKAAKFRKEYYLEKR